jgi:sodium/hydrogen antiporter
LVDVYILDLLVVGLLLLFVTLGSGWIARLPLSYALIYLIVGIALGPYGTGLVREQPPVEFLERLTELVVIISIFSCGLKVNRPLKLWAWNSTARLIGFLMPLSILGIAAIGHWVLGLSWGLAILLGAILAPTDPVLASEVQLTSVDDPDELRFGLTSEGGLNDALAFPFVYFGLHWLQNDSWQTWFRQWVLVDLLWAIAAAVVMGILVAKGVLWIDGWLQRYRAADQLMEDFVALSTILLTYSLTEVVNGYGFLAVFVAGLVVQRGYFREKRLSQLEFTEQLEKLLEVGTILLLGTYLRIEPILRFAPQALLMAGLLLFAIRPAGTWLSTFGEQFHPLKRGLIGWFGIRGVGSIYYLNYALSNGLEGQNGQLLIWITYLTVVVSVFLHGVTVTPLMHYYKRYFKQQTE